MLGIQAVEARKEGATANVNADACNISTACIPRKAGRYNVSVACRPLQNLANRGEVPWANQGAVTFVRVIDRMLRVVEYVLEGRGWVHGQSYLQGYCGSATNGL